MPTMKIRPQLVVEREAAGRFPGEHAAQDATVPGLHGVGFVPADDGRAWGEDIVHNRLLRAAKFRGEIRPDGEANIVCLVAGGAVLTENLLPSRWIALGDERIGVLPEFTCVGGTQLCERLFRPLGRCGGKRLRRLVHLLDAGTHERRMAVGERLGAERAERARRARRDAALEEDGGRVREAAPVPANLGARPKRKALYRRAPLNEGVL